MGQMSYYTPEMRRAFHSIPAPKNFYVDVVEHSDDKQLFFIDLMFDKALLLNASHEEKMDIYRYLQTVKNALVDAGAVVQVTGRAAKPR
jgi:hypothetical protein